MHFSRSLAGGGQTTDRLGTVIAWATVVLAPATVAAVALVAFLSLGFTIPWSTGTTDLPSGGGHSGSAVLSATAEPAPAMNTPLPTSPPITSVPAASPVSARDPGSARTATSPSVPAQSATPLVATATAVPAPTSEPTTYVVKSGDTLWSISAQFGVPGEEIMKANDLTDPAFVRTGQRLVIPQSP